jgi:hypothetical protein
MERGTRGHMQQRILFFATQLLPEESAVLLAGPLQSLAAACQLGVRCDAHAGALQLQMEEQQGSGNCPARALQHHIRSSVSPTRAHRVDRHVQDA